MTNNQTWKLSQEELAFLEAIRALPADIMPRLIYADWLEDRNDPRAEFIRLHHQLATVFDRLQHLRPTLDQQWMQTVEVSRHVVLHGFAPERRREVIKRFRQHSGCGVEQARDALANLPTILFADQPLERAERLRQDFADIANISIEPVTPVNSLGS